MGFFINEFSIVLPTEEEMQEIEKEQVEEEYVQDDLDTQEIEIETEATQVIEEPVVEAKTVKTTVPPLRPLTIAPKPTKTVPIQLKPAAGPQLLLLPSKNGIGFVLYRLFILFY